MASSTAGSSIWYYVDDEGPWIYTGSFTLTRIGGVSIRAWATHAGWLDSAVVHERLFLNGTRSPVKRFVALGSC